jgi:cation diffusion facilitator CzcD-associated flavoprotein CzcO
VFTLRASSIQVDDRPQGVSVGIVGAGVSGMAAGLCLQRHGVRFTIFEQAEEVGGTWWENRYPGLTIDVPSPIYTFSGLRNPNWRRFLPDQAEILAYHRDVSIQTGLRERIRFDSKVVSARWTGVDWEVGLAGGGSERFRVLVCATGFLHHPRIPDIDGLDSFAGDCVHSALWHDDLEIGGRRVGVIGNGSSGVQLVTALAGVASRVVLFQRTPQWVFPGMDFTIPLSVRSLFERRPTSIEAVVSGIEWLADWLLQGAAARPSSRRRFVEAVARWHLRKVRDPELRRRLTPRDSALCKRPVVSSGFYSAVQRDDVEVISSGIAHIEQAGVRTADGNLHELDVLILATGFRAHDYMRPIRIVGEHGAELEDLWADGPYGYRTLAIPGFPNLFMIMGPHSPLLSFPVHRSAELQSEYVAQIVELLSHDGVVSVSVRPEAAQRWLDELRAGLDGTVWTSGCTSWYLGDGEVPVVWPYDRQRWREILREPVLDDYDIRRSAHDRERPMSDSGAGARPSTTRTLSSIASLSLLCGGSVR